MMYPKACSACGEALYHPEKRSGVCRRCERKDEPKSGVTYRLTGPGPSILAGNTWAESRCAERVPVLCGCGWGSLSMDERDVPAQCPVCGSTLGEV
jgi:hypothetical protein